MTNKRALESVKIIDFTWFMAGPLALKYLANNGAEIIHVESMQRPCITRVGGPFKDDVPGVNRSGYFATNAAGKYSLALNLSHPRSWEVLEPLVKRTDAVVENFTPGTMKRWKLDYDNLCTINSEIIMMSMSMYGQTGPLAAHPGVGIQGVGFAGFTSITGWPDRDPVPPYGAYTDALSSRIGAACLMAAIDYKRRTGKGQYIDLSQSEASIHFLATPLLDYQAYHRVAHQAGNASPCAAPHGVYRCYGEDNWCAISITTEAEWQSFCLVVNKKEWTRDPRFCTLGQRKINEAELNKLVEAWTINFSPEEVMAQLQLKGIAAGLVAKGSDLFSDPQLSHRHFFQWLDHQELGYFAHAGESSILSETPAFAGEPAALLGQHTEYICRELLGMSKEKFTGLSNDGVFN